MTPLAVSEAHAILRADEALDATFQAREASGQTLGSQEADAWINLVKSAHDRIAAYEGNEPDFQTLFVEAVAGHRVESRTGYTIKRLTADDAVHVAELLRVSIDDKHWRAWHPKLREIREKMIERMGDQEKTP